MIARLLVFVGVLGWSAAAVGQGAADDRARRVGRQWVITTHFLDALDTAKVTSPHLPARKPLYEKVDKARKQGTTVQNPWGDDGDNRHMRVRVRKTRVDRVMKDLRDCLVLPLPGRAEYAVDVLPGSVLLFAPELVRMGAGNARLQVLIDGEPVWSEVLAGRGMYDNTWKEVSVPLDPWVGKKVTLAFEVDKPSLGAKRWEKRGKHRAVALFALPRIVTSVTADDRILREQVRAVVGDDLNYNVVMFVFDSGRADLMTPVREEKGRIPSLTPHLDAFMKPASLFSRAFSVGNQTRIGSYSMYLATPPAAGGFWSIKWGLSKAFRESFYATKPVSLPRELRKAGYLTGHLGFNGFLTGFQYLSLDMGFDFVGEYNGVPENTVRMTDGIIEWLEAHKDQKFFLLVWFDPPHFPYNPPPEYLKRLEATGHDLSDRYFEPKYLAKMMYGDDYFGKIAQTMTRLGLDEKTLYLVTADHGEAMDPRHEGYSKNVNTRVIRHHGKTFYDEEVHVPLAIRLDGVIEPRVVKDQVSLVSLSPTIRELLGLPTDSVREFGRSFASLVRGGKEAIERLVYFEGRWSHGIRHGGYKYIWHDPRERLKMKSESLFQRKRDWTDEIFDLEKDPDELVNIATTQPEVRRTMRKKYAEFREKMRQFRRSRSPEGALFRPLDVLREKH